MKVGRRGFLGMLGLSPVAGKAALDKEALKLAGLVHEPGLGQQSYGVGMSLSSPSAGNGYDPGAEGLARRLAFAASKALRENVESELYAMHKQVACIDPDLAVLKSLSLSAKITFQRQRNVQRTLESEYFESAPWRRVRNLFRNCTL